MEAMFGQRRVEQADGQVTYHKRDVDIRQAMLTVKGQLLNPKEIYGCWRTDPALFDQFLRSYEAVDVIAGQWPAIKILQQYAERGLDAIIPPKGFTARTKDDASISRSMHRFIKRTADIAEAKGNLADAQWILDTFNEEYIKGGPIPLASVEGQFRALGKTPTLVQRRLFKAATRTGLPPFASRRRSANVEVAADSAAHAEKFQSIFGSNAKEAKKASPPRGFGFGAHVPS
ncbi:hypothetical protein Slin14017_G106510 [Septoria linicola]|nr:hypothetical protein Slin14017_G106510 [Septoria linicola]